MFLKIFFATILLFISQVIGFGQSPCPAPLNLNASAVTTSSATVSWTGTAAISEVQYGITGFTLGNGTSVTGAISPLVLSNLNPNTAYEFYVRDICSTGDTSVWTGPESFTTIACFSAMAPFFDDVEAHVPNINMTNSQCWSTSTPSFVYWGIEGNGSTSTINTGPMSANTGSNYFYFETSVGAQGDYADLFTPTVDLSALTSPNLVFAYYMYGATVDTLEVSINDGSGWIEVFQINGQQQATDSLPWIPEVISLAGYSGLVQARFRAYKGSWFTGDIALDDIGFLDCLGDTTVSIVTCDSIVAVAGNVYTIPGNYIDTLINPAGCGSTIIYNLTLLSPSSSIATHSTCEPFTWIDGVTYTQSNNAASFILQNTLGCDSTITLDLTVYSFDPTVIQIGPDTLQSNQAGATYQWLDCNSGNAPIAGATNQIFVPTVNGNYAVAVSNANCTDTSSCISITTVGLSENEVGFAKVCPNPITNILTIDLINNDRVELEIIDMQGKVVVAPSMIVSGQNIDVSKLESGVYFVRLIAGDHSMVKRVVKH
ncbi:MAG: T9SS type A sorting domain-containing protein [Crocinitomicaceae bacterium]